MNIPPSSREDSIRFPCISVIIPHFDRPRLLRAAMESVLSSPYPNLDLIVIDDGSPDDAWRTHIHSTDPRIRTFVREDGVKGPSRCRNLGMLHARGDYIVFLDSDDLMAPWCLEERLKLALQAPEADLWVFPVMLFKKLPGDMDLLWNAMTGDCDPAERFARSDPPWHTSSPLWKRESLLRLGGFNEEVFYGDDSDLHLRVLVDGLIVRLYPDALPDAFVRRSVEPRITNSLSQELIESRRVRLREGTRFLKSRSGTSRLLNLWEGQYFVEAEFLLFNHLSSSQAIYRILNDWEKSFITSLSRRLIVRSYFIVAQACRCHAYLMLRIARRIAMLALPGEYFPTGGGFHSARATPQIMALLAKSESVNSPPESMSRE